MIIEGNKLQPSEGYKYITNGEVFSTLVYLGKHDSVDNWHDTNDEPPAPQDEHDKELAAVIDDAEKMANDLM